MKLFNLVLIVSLLSSLYASQKVYEKDPTLCKFYSQKKEIYLNEIKKRAKKEDKLSLTTLKELLQTTQEGIDQFCEG